MEVLAAVEYVAEFLAWAPKPLYSCCLLREGDGGQQLLLMQRCQRGVQFLHRMSSRFDDQSDVKSCSLQLVADGRIKRNFKKKTLNKRNAHAVPDGDPERQ